VVFIHSASRADKLYPEPLWRELIAKFHDTDLRIRLPWGSEVEKARAERLADGHKCMEVLPKLNLQGLACVLVQATAVVSVDTGLGHLSAALGVPTVSLYNSGSSGVEKYDGKRVHLFPLSAKAGLTKDLVTQVEPDTIGQESYDVLNEKNLLSAGG